MKNINKIKQFILLGGDIAVLYASLYLTLFIRYWQKPAVDMWQNHFWPFTVIFAAWIIVFYIARLYDLHLAVNNIRFFQMTNYSLLAAVLLALAFFYAAPQIGIAPKTNLLIYIVVFYFLFFFWRRLFNSSLKSYLPKKNIAIVGLNKEADELIEELKRNPHLGYNVALIIADRHEDIANLEKLIVENKISTIILTSNIYESPALRAALFNCLPLKINFISLPHFYETITGKIPIEIIGQSWFLENLNEANKSWFDFLKRIYDIILAFVIFMLTFPFWPLIAIIIKLESRGPVFFKQTRVGKNETPFAIIKFRTMATSGNDLSPTAVNDKRITGFGSILRKIRADEIPQVINILRGEMSFVGPRPERPEISAGLEKAIPFYRERMLVKPGATGWDQISGEYHSPSVEDSLEKLQYDLFYIKNRSIHLDLSIILKTIATIISRGGI